MHGPNFCCSCYLELLTRQHHKFLSSSHHHIISQLYHINLQLCWGRRIWSTSFSGSFLVAWKFLMCKIGSHPTSATDLPFGVCNLNRSALYAERIFSSSGRWWLTFRSELREFIWKGWRNNQMTASKNKIEENNPDKNNKAVTVDPPSWEK